MQSISHFTSQKFRFWTFISMILLVYVHAYNLQISYLQPWTIPGENRTTTTFLEYFTANGIFRFRIPMLFIISGYLFAYGDSVIYKKRIKKRLKTVFLPYLIWSAFGLLLTFLLERFTYTRNIIAATHMMQLDESRLLLHDYKWYEVIARWIFFPVSYQLWFLRVLFVYNLMYPAIRWCVLHKIVKWIFFPLVILFWLSTNGFVIIEGDGLLFFATGVWMQKINFNIEKPNKWLNVKAWATVFVITALVKTYLALNNYFNGLEPVLLLLHKLCIFSGLITAWYGCNFLVKFFMDKQWFVKTAAFSFMIYVLHAPFVVYANKMISITWPHFKYLRITTYILMPLALIFTAIVIGFLFRKLAPKVYAMSTGGRGF